MFPQTAFDQDLCLHRHSLDGGNFLVCPKQEANYCKNNRAGILPAACPLFSHIFFTETDEKLFSEAVLKVWI
jgi:hypothetical protein